MEHASRGRLFEVASPSSEDLTRARELPLLTACPRRYCWWWQSLAFDWDTTVAEGCRFLSTPKLVGWQWADVPCLRSVPGSEIDHYEPREPHLEADGFDRYRFCGSQHNIPEGDLLTFKHLPVYRFFRIPLGLVGWGQSMASYLH
jgi:hypothetical protein